MKPVVWRGAIFGALLCAAAFSQHFVPLKAVIYANATDQARLARLQGKVVLSATIGTDGRATQIRVVEPLGLGLDESAVTAAENWHFTPRATPVELQLECNFVPSDVRSADWSLTHAQFTAPEGASQPVIRSAPFASTRAAQSHVLTRVAFDIDPQGVPQNIVVQQSADPADDDEVIQMIREWRFEAALRNGTAVEAHAVFDFSRGINPSVPGEVNIRMAQPPQKKQ